MLSLGRVQLRVVDVEAGLDPQLVRAATSGGATLVAATDAVNNTPSPQTDSADSRLKSFIERVMKARQPPLLELPKDDSTPDRRPPAALPKRSRRIAAQSLFHILVAKRGEHLVMKCLGLTSGMSTHSTSAMKAYEEIYGDDPDPDHVEALRELFPPDDDVGVRKRRRHCSAVWA
jgi:uncharacterized protein with von Willebrand factor type A (vWA) domain